MLQHELLRPGRLVPSINRAYRRLELFVFWDRTDGSCVAAPLVFGPMPPMGEPNPVPTMTLDNDFAQTLMDELWRTGFRPTEAAGSVGQLDATLAHLDDMRVLVAHALKVELTGATIIKTAVDAKTHL
jgi:uncharacterized protein YaaQ